MKKLGFLAMLLSIGLFVVAAQIGHPENVAKGMQEFMHERLLDHRVWLVGIDHNRSRAALVNPRTGGVGLFGQEHREHVWGQVNCKDVRLRHSFVPRVLGSPGTAALLP